MMIINDYKMKKLTLYILIGFTLTLGLNTYAQNEQRSQKSISDTWKTITLENCSLEYPSEWDYQKMDQDLGSGFVIVSKQTSNQDLFTENVSLMITDLMGMELKPEEYGKIFEKQIKSSPSTKTIETKKQHSNNLDFYTMTYSKVQNGDLHLIIQQSFWTYKGRAYTLTFTGKEADYPSYQETLNRITNSFSIKLT